MENHVQSLTPEELKHLQNSSFKQLERYFSHTNKIIGITGFGFALACIGLELPSFFAWVSAFFLVFVWADGIDHYRRHLAVLRTLGEPKISWYLILWRTRVALVGWLALGCVAIGLVNKSGIVHT
jgi:hypothetical protein